MMRRRSFLALPVLFAGTGCATKTPIRRAVDALWDFQAADGGWHSSTYGLMRSGQSLTPFVLQALLSMPEKIPETRVERALEFLRAHTDKDGALGRMDPVSDDYPNYATALAVTAICKSKRPGFAEQAAPLVACLRRQQFAGDRGYSREALAYGGWGMGGALHTAPYTGHVDLSMTRHVLQALAAAGVPAGDPVFQRALVFLGRCQYADGDGGFFFSPVILDANKAGQDGERFRSYGTATADGLLSLLACGLPASDRRVGQASTWLRRNHSAVDAPGFHDQAHARWTVGLRYYYASASADAFRRLGLGLDRAMTAHLVDTRRSDGLWVNPETLVKEDDPLIATPFALSAMA